MRNALRAELYKVYRRRMTYILLGAAAALVLLFYIILWLRVREGPRHSDIRSLRRSGSPSAMASPSKRRPLRLGPRTLLRDPRLRHLRWHHHGQRIRLADRRRRHLPRRQTLALPAREVISRSPSRVVVAASASSSPWPPALVQPALRSLLDGAFTFTRIADAFASLAGTSFVILPFVLMSLLFATQWRSAGQAVGASLGSSSSKASSPASSTTPVASSPTSRTPSSTSTATPSWPPTASSAAAPMAAAPFGVPTGGPPEWRAALVLCAWLSLAVAAFWRFQSRDIQE